MTASEAYYQWLRERTTSEVIRQAASLPGTDFSCGEHVPPENPGPGSEFMRRMFGPAPEQPESPSRLLSGEDLAGEWHLLPGQPGPPELAAAAMPGDSHIWVTVPLPAAGDQVTLGGTETHRLDQSMIRSQDGYGRYAAWLETTLTRQWPAGTEVAAC